MLNIVCLNGRLTKDIEVKATEKGKSARFLLAVNRDYKNEDGSRDADFIPCVIFGESAVNLAKYAGKGTLISVFGEMRTNQYEDQSGKKNMSVNIVVRKFNVLEKKKEQQTESQPEYTNYTEDSMELPF